MRCQPRPFVNVLPAEQHVVLLQHGLDAFLAEDFANRAPVLVVDGAARLVQHLPAALPGKIAEVRVFQIERMEQRIEAAQLEKLPAVEGAGPAAAVETGEEIVDGGVDAMPHAQAAILPPALGETGLLADFVRVREEDLAGDGEDLGIAEAFEQRSEKAGGHAHVVVEQHHDAVPGGANTRIGTTAEAQIARQREERDLRERGSDEIGAAVGGAVVDYHDFVFGIAGQGFDHRGEVLLQQVFSVPVGDYDGGGLVGTGQSLASIALTAWPWGIGLSLARPTSFAGYPSAAAPRN